MTQRALGTTLSIGATTPVTVAGLTSINGLELSADTIDATTLNSTGVTENLKLDLKMLVKCR